MNSAFTEDILGEPFISQKISLSPDWEGERVASLISYSKSMPRRRAVLYIHGFIDYFFQTELAETIDNAGWDFFALDLQKYGRSLLPHQTPNYVRHLSDHKEELDAAIRILRNTGHEEIVLLGHSTGGLIASLWAESRQDDQELAIDGLILNSPWVDLNENWLLRKPGTALIKPIAGIIPDQTISFLDPTYARMLHTSGGGEWNFNLDWKPIEGFPVKLAWLNSVRTGQQRLAKGLNLNVPILLATAATSTDPKKKPEYAISTDSVLNVEHMHSLAHKLGGDVASARFDGGCHDLALSSVPVRNKYFKTLTQWLAITF